MLSGKLEGLEENFESAPLCEMMVVVRPEDRAAIFRVLEGETGCEFISHHALGRGYDGGLSYGSEAPKSRLVRWVDRPPVLSFLPKIVFWAVLETGRAEALIEKLGAAVRLNGGPAQCAGGFAVIAEIEQQFPMGITLGSGTKTGQELPAETSDTDMKCVLI